MKEYRLIAIILVLVLFSLACDSPEYNSTQEFIDNCKYKITMFDSNAIRYANSYIIQDGFVIIEEYATATWDSVYPIKYNKLLLPVDKTIIEELR